MQDYEKIDFIGIGSGKSGSTWIGECLKEHPEIGFSSEKHKGKELRFFNTPDWGGLHPGSVSNYDKGLSWYFNQIPQRGKVRGEVSPGYLPDPKAVRRIKEVFPNVKILVVLRNPVDMLYSLYCAHKSGVASEVPETFRFFVEDTRVKELGLYGKHLTRYFEMFPAKNIYTMFFEDIKSRPREVLKDLYSFLGVDPNFVPSFFGGRVNPTFIPRFEWLKSFARVVVLGLQRLGFKQLSEEILRNQTLYKLYLKINRTSRRYPPLDKEMRAKLKQYYLGDIQKLEGLIGRDLSLWK